MIIAEKKINTRPEEDRFLEKMEQKGYCWANGVLPTKYRPNLEFPCYIHIWSSKVLTWGYRSIPRYEWGNWNEH